MKYIFIFLFFIESLVTLAQNSISIYSGLNLSIFSEKSSFANTDRNTTSILLPHIGFDFRTPLRNRFALSSGVGINIAGVNNYHRIDIDSIGNGNLGISPNLRVSYLSFNFKMTRELFKKTSALLGYSLNYSIRKNQNFFYIDSYQGYTSLKSVYSKFRHAAILGLMFDFNKFQITTDIQFGLNRIYDSRFYYYGSNFGYRKYANMNILQFSVGYSISE